MTPRPLKVADLATIRDMSARLCDANRTRDESIEIVAILGTVLKTRWYDSRIVIPLGRVGLSGA